MALEIKIPSPGESITEVELASWFVEDGALVTKNQEVGEIESEKATLPLIATEPGQIKILVQEGETIKVGTVVASIDTSVEVPDASQEIPNKPAEDAVAKEVTRTVDQKSAPEPSSIKVPPEHKNVKVTPVAKQMMEQEGLSMDDILNGLRKINAGDGIRTHEDLCHCDLNAAP